MQGRPLRCQHGRRWSQSARARWCCISWRSGGRLAVPGPKSDRAAPSWRGWVAQKSAAHHAMVPMQLNKHCHSRDLAERWRLAYCIILWPLYSLRNGQRPRMCRILVGGPCCSVGFRQSYRLRGVSLRLLFETSEIPDSGKLARSASSLRSMLICPILNILSSGFRIVEKLLAVWKISACERAWPWSGM